MNSSIYNKVIQALQQAENHNSSVMVKPEVILWPDPEKQWLEVIDVLQETLPQLLIYGDYNTAEKQGPAIWLKCMTAKMLPEADWQDGATPIIYMPGVAKADLRNVENAVFNFQPLLEYQYNGTLFLQENGREWTILAFVQNPTIGLGVNISVDNATKDALKKALPTIFRDEEVLVGRTIIDADYLNNQLFPDVVPSIVKWMCKGEEFLAKLSAGHKEAFINICNSRFDFQPDQKNIKAIAEKLGAQKNAWKNVWQLYAAAPHKYEQIEDLLRLAKPGDLGTGIFKLPDESWPQLNEQKEELLYETLKKAAKQDLKKCVKLLEQAEEEHRVRRNWVWYELGRSPLANALQYLVPMVIKATEGFGSGSVKEIETYYTTSGFKVDQWMRKALAVVKSSKDVAVINDLIQLVYKPWLETITNKFQQFISVDPAIFTKQNAGIKSETCVLFVDAFRYELAEAFCLKIKNLGYKVQLESKWSSIPSVTPTAKPGISPIAPAVSTHSTCNEFRPQLQNGKDLLTNVFRDALINHNYQFTVAAKDVAVDGKHWLEIGDIDTKGHNEQAGVVKRIDELLDKVQETLEIIFEKGIKRVKIVTDHGWLLLPGGLPKTSLHAGLAESRWGRCALIKEGAKTDLLHLPWRWNPSVYIAYAPGISFFKANVEYAHGGISIHECLVPQIIIEQTMTNKFEAEIKAVKWVNLKCSINTTDVPDGFKIDIRTKYNDEGTTVVDVSNRNKVIKGNQVTLMADDRYEHQSAMIVLTDDKGIILDKKPTVVGGEN